VRQTAVSRSQTDCSYGRLLVVSLELLYFYEWMPSRAKHFSARRSSRALANIVVARCANRRRSVRPRATTAFPRGAAFVPRRRRARCAATREARRPRTRRTASSTSGRRSRRRARATSRVRVRAPTRPTPTRERPRGDARTPRPGASRPRGRLRWTTSPRLWSRRRTRGARWARSPARWAGPADDARVREPSKPRGSTRTRSTRDRDRERRATGISSSLAGSRRGRASGWKRPAGRKPRRSAVRSRAWASRASDPSDRRARLKLAKLKRARGDRSGTPPSRPAEGRTSLGRTSRASARTRVSRRAPRRNGGASGTAAPAPPRDD
jgi:hypothetical protein